MRLLRTQNLEQEAEEGTYIHYLIENVRHLQPESLTLGSHNIYAL